MTPPKSFVEAIGEMVHPGLRCDQLVLVENDPQSSLPPIQLKRSGQRVLLLQLDQKLELRCEHQHPIHLEVNRRMFPLLNPQVPGATRCCDYVLFSQRADGTSDEALTVLLIELKSTSSNGALKQIENGSLLVRHLLNLVEYHQRRKCPVNWRGVVFSGGRGPKGGTSRLRCPYEAVQLPVGTGSYITLKADTYSLAYLCDP